MFRSTRIGGWTIEHVEDRVQVFEVALTAQQVGALDAVTSPQLPFPIPFLRHAPGLYGGETTIHGEARSLRRRCPNGAASTTELLQARACSGSCSRLRRARARLAEGPSVGSPTSRVERPTLESAWPGPRRPRSSPNSWGARARVSSLRALRRTASRRTPHVHYVFPSPALANDRLFGERRERESSTGWRGPVRSRFVSPRPSTCDRTVTLVSAAGTSRRARYTHTSKRSMATAKRRADLRVRTTWAPPTSAQTRRFPSPQQPLGHQPRSDRHPA
jgi:hypothetical protein